MADDDQRQASGRADAGDDPAASIADTPAREEPDARQERDRPAEQHQHRCQRRAFLDDAQAKWRTAEADEEWREQQGAGGHRRQGAQPAPAPLRLQPGRVQAEAGVQQPEGSDVPGVDDQQRAERQGRQTLRPPRAQRVAATHDVRCRDGQDQDLERQGHEVRVQIAQQRREERELVDAVGSKVGNHA